MVRSLDQIHYWCMFFLYKAKECILYEFIHRPNVKGLNDHTVDRSHNSLICTGNMK